MRRWCAYVIRLPDVGMNALNLRWVNPLNSNRCYFVWAWPRRDNMWARWRYESFTSDGDLVHWKYAAQKVFW